MLNSKSYIIFSLVRRKLDITLRCSFISNKSMISYKYFAATQLLLSGIAALIFVGK